ncbi:MAG: ClpXP protease specificity-enhancing factor SspB [Parvibaculaceae bacterium]|nr:ClpXP protease specificity-enhancing factor SspB [Parvibaculaceae bacterium]
MAEDLMRYDLLAREALRGVVREALKRVVAEGLPGDHHFYISVKTDAPGVIMSDRLRAQFPAEITIVLQHQFWNLEVFADRFSVELSFSQIPEKLTIPFAAIQGFFDPSVQFGLQFEVDENGEPLDALYDDEEGETDSVTQEDAETPDDEPVGKGAVVSLDAFRKK